eukprot:jgi/Mesen1/1410/ME000130S00497
MLHSDRVALFDCDTPQASRKASTSQNWPGPPHASAPRPPIRPSETSGTDQAHSGSSFTPALVACALLLAIHGPGPALAGPAPTGIYQQQQLWESVTPPVPEVALGAASCGQGCCQSAPGSRQMALTRSSPHGANLTQAGVQSAPALGPASAPASADGRQVDRLSPSFTDSSYSRGGVSLRGFRQGVRDYSRLGRTVMEAAMAGMSASEQRPSLLSQAYTPRAHLTQPASGGDAHAGGSSSSSLPLSPHVTGADLTSLERGGDAHLAGFSFSSSSSSSSLMPLPHVIGAHLTGPGLSLALDYNEMVKLHEDAGQRKTMFTSDAWRGMMRLRDYDEIVRGLQDEEQRCLECTRNRRLLEQVWQTVSNEFFDQHGRFSQSEWSGELARSLEKAGGPLRTKAQTYAVVKEMVARLGDPYSAFLDPFRYRLAIHRPLLSEIKYLAYQYTGIGIELGPPSEYGGLTIVAPFAGSPAEEVDIMVAGPSPASPPRVVTLERRALPLPPVRMRLVSGPDGRLVEYLRLHYFTHQGTKDMAAAIREGEALGVDGYILDLRNNPGGVFEEAIAMAALWLDCPHCDVAETVRSSSSSSSPSAISSTSAGMSASADIEDAVYQVGRLPVNIFGKHPGALTHAPLVVITNRSSASASEVLTGALRDNGRATVIGERTFGKGVVQYYFPMDDGSGLKLTVAKYLTPGRYDITLNGGLLPDSFCTDHPRANSSDACILKAMDAVTDARADEERRRGASGSESARMPYRWPPPEDKRLWASGTY